MYIADGAKQIFVEPKYPACYSKAFKVATVSSNIGSFGHRSVIFIARDGEAWRINVLASNWASKPLAKGQIVNIRFGGWGGGIVLESGWEVPDRLTPDANAGVIGEVWGADL